MHNMDWADKLMREGHVGYARHQAEQFRAMRARCEHLWRFVDIYVQNGEGTIIPPEVIVAEEDDESL